MLRLHRLVWPHRFRFAFRLRTLLVVVGLAAVWSAYYFSPAKREGRAIRALESAGVRVSYDYQRALLPKGYSYQVAAPGPSLARAVFGKEFFQTALCVDLNNAPVLAEDFSHVAQLRHIRDLGMANARIGDDHMVSLAGLTMLESVILPDNKITDRGLAYLSQSTELQSLELSKNNIRGSGLKYLQGMTKLRQLGLHHNPVSDQGLVHLATLTNLVHLGLANSNITDEGLERLVHLRNLRYLGLSGTYITRPAVKEFQKRLPNCNIESYNLRQK